MVLRTLPLLLLLIAAPAHADVAQALRDRILPGHATFATATADLAREAAQDCRGPGVTAAFNTAYDGWMGIQHIRLGPIEEDGRGLAIAFWPDPKGMGLRAQRALVDGDPAALDPRAFAGQSVAARGLTGLERLLFTDEVPGDTCPLIRATAADLARVAAELDAGWRDDFGPLLAAPGAEGNTRFLSQAEARQALFTQIVTGLEYVRDQRLGRPLGSFDRPAPQLAEARASARGLRNVVLSLQAIRDLAAALSDDDAPRTLAALDRAIAQAKALPDPDLSGTATPQGRLRTEIVQQSVDAARITALEELGPALGVTVGFNAMDGD